MTYCIHVSWSDDAADLQSVDGHQIICNRKQMHMVGLMTHLNCGCCEHHLCCRLNGLSAHYPAHVKGIHVAVPTQDIPIMGFK